MRITENLKIASLTEANAENASRLHLATRRAVTGERVSAPSDDPAAYAQIARFRSSAATYEARKHAVERAEDTLAFAESALASAVDVMARAGELAVQMADGTLGPAERASAAKEVTQLRQTLVGIANSRTASGYVFGGTKTDAEPFSSAGAFAGNDEAIDVEIAEGSRIRSNASGARAFTAAGGRDLFQDLQAFETALTNDDVTAVQGMITAMDQGHAQITAVRSEAGLSIASLRMAGSASLMGRNAIEAARARVQEVDATEAYVELSSAQQAYERSLEITRKILSIMPGDKILAR